MIVLYIIILIMSLLLMVVFRVPNFYTFDIHLSINFIMICFFTQLSLIIFELQQHSLPNEISTVIPHL